VRRAINRFIQVENVNGIGHGVIIEQGGIQAALFSSKILIDHFLENIFSTASISSCGPKGLAM
jgi:hypothetical protein